MQLSVGEFAWGLFAAKDIRLAKEAVARTATLREEQVIELHGKDDQFLRVWMWPMDPPNSAVCMLCLRIPGEIAALTARERDCLGLLAQGYSTKLIAEELNIGMSTVHTHLKRMRTKLELPRVEAVISFAARFFHPSLIR